MDRKGVVIVVLSCLLATSTFLHWKKAGYDELSRLTVEVEPDKILHERTVVNKRDVSERKCLDDDKPFKCSPDMMCYGFDHYCSDRSGTVEPCIPALSNPLDWCRQYVQGQETLLNPQCQFACQFKFNTSQLYPQEEYTSNTPQLYSLESTMLQQFNTTSQQLNIMLQQLNNKLQQLHNMSQQLNIMPQQLNNKLQQFNTTSQQLNTMSQQFIIMSQQLNNMLQQFNTTSQQLNTMPQQLNNKLQQFNTTSQQLNTMSQQYNNILQQFNTKSQQLNTIPQQLHNILQQFNTTSQLYLEKAQENVNCWFVWSVVLGVLLFLSFGANIYFMVKLRKTSSGYTQVAQHDEYDTMKDCEPDNEEAAGKNHDKDAAEVIIEGDRVHAKMQRKKEADSQSRQKTQPGANSTTPASTSSSSKVPNQNDMGATMRGSADENACGQSPYGSPVVSQSSFASSSTGAQALGVEQKPILTETEGEENRKRQGKDITAVASIHNENE